MKKPLTQADLREMILELKTVTSALPDSITYAPMIYAVESAYRDAFGHLEFFVTSNPQDKFTDGIAAALGLREQSKRH